MAESSWAGLRFLSHSEQQLDQGLTEPADICGKALGSNSRRPGLSIRCLLQEPGRCHWQPRVLVAPLWSRVSIGQWCEVIGRHSLPRETFSTGQSRCLLPLGAPALHLVLFFSPHPGLCLLFSERGEGRETSMWERTSTGCLPYCHLGVCPAQGGNPQLFGVQDSALMGPPRQEPLTVSVKEETDANIRTSQGSSRPDCQWAAQRPL